MRLCHHMTGSYATRRVSPAKIIIALMCLFAMSSTARADSEKPAVGVVAPLSGYIASIGTAIRNGIELAQLHDPQRMNAVNFRFEDDQHDPKLALTAYRHLKTGATPSAVMAFGFFFPTVLGRTVAQDKIPLINFSFYAKPAIGNPYIVRSMNHTRQYGQALAEFLASEEQLEYPVIRTEYDFFLQLLDDTAAHLHAVKPIAKLTTFAQVLPADRDFRAIISRLKSVKAARIGVFLFADQLVTFMRQAREGGLTAQIFGCDLCETAAKSDGAQKYLEGCIYPDNDVSAEFRRQYRVRYGNESQLTFAGAAYDMSTLLAEYLGQNPKGSSEQLLQALSQVRNRQGVLGSFSFKDEAAVGKFFEYPVAIKKISEGAGVALPAR
jgi:ABC-type branched-subunit amino acid transport system substrate-binding protein